MWALWEQRKQIHDQQCIGIYRPRPNERDRDFAPRRPIRQSSDLLFSAARRRALLRELQKKAWNKYPSSTKLYDLPLEILDIILQKSYLHCVLNSSLRQRDEEAISSLISVDVFFYRRIIRQRFKKAIWRCFEDFYENTRKRSVIIRNNRNYLLEHIQPNDEFIASLLSLDCLAQEQSRFIEKQRSNRNKNVELLRITRSFNKTKFSNFVECLRQTNQKMVARIIESGGDVIKITIRRGKGTTSLEAQQLHQAIEDLPNRAKPRSHQTDKVISQLKDEDIEILNSQLDRQCVVVWIWCHSQTALEHIKRLYRSNQLKDVFKIIQPFFPMVINIEQNQFKKTVVVCPMSVNFTQRIRIRGKNHVWGVTKLLNDIYVLCEPRSSHSYRHLIKVFENRNPFRLRKEIELKQMNTPHDLGSSEKENCLYVSDFEEKCVWKITGATDYQCKIIKWLRTDYRPTTLSMSSEGHLLVVNHSSAILMIYESDSELIRSIRLPPDFKYPSHAVETSMGNFIVLYMEEEKDDTKKSWSNQRIDEINWNLCELTRDGQMVIRRFTPSNEAQQLNYPNYLSIDSSDRVFVADASNNRVILLDANLKWNRVLCPAKEEKETRIQLPRRLCYEEEVKQLIVGGIFGVNVYTLRCY